MAVERQRGLQVAPDGRLVQGEAGPGEDLRVSGDPALGAGQGDLQHGVVGADHEVEAGGEFGDLVAAPDVAGELLDPDHEPFGVQLGQQVGAQVHLGVDGVVVRGDGQARRGHQFEVFEHRAVVGAVGVGRQAHDRLAARVLGELRVPLGLPAAVGADARHDGEPLGRVGDGGLDDAVALLVREGLVLAQRPVGRDAVHPLLGEVGDALAVGAEVDREVVVERQAGRDDDAVPGLAGLAHEHSLSGSALSVGSSSRPASAPRVTGVATSRSAGS